MKKVFPVKMTEINGQTGEKTEREMEFHLGLTPPGTCEECGKAHDPKQPHNAQSLHYQYYFYAQHRRWPDWRDAMAHCEPDVQQTWRDELIKIGVDVDAGKLGKS